MVFEIPIGYIANFDKYMGKQDVLGLTAQSDTPTSELTPCHARAADAILACLGKEHGV